jgi:hypothetical protein
MLARRLAYGLFGLGIVLICGALVWWALAEGSGPFACAFSKACIAAAAPGVPPAESSYDPAILWAGGGLLVVAVLVAFCGVFGVVLLLAALSCLGRELYGFFAEGSWSFMPLGTVWRAIHTPTLLLLEPAIVRHLSEELWYDWIEPILLAPAWIALGAPALVLLLLYFAFGRRRHRRLFQRARGPL